MANYRSLNIPRDYANQMFGPDLAYILQQPRNRFLVIDFAAQLYNKLIKWGIEQTPTRDNSLATVNENQRSDKFYSYPMTGVNGTYIRLQGLLDKAYLFVNPNDGSTFNPLAGYEKVADVDNYNYVSAQCGLLTGPVFPFTGNVTARDGTVVPLVAATTQDYETAYNTPTGDQPYIRHTASVNDLGEAIFRLSPDQPDPALITVWPSTGSQRMTIPAQRGPFIGPTRPYAQIFTSHI